MTETDPIAAIRNAMHHTQNLPYTAKASVQYQGEVIWSPDAGLPGGS